MFKNPEKLENCISLVVTKADAEINTEGMVDEIDAILRDNPRLINPSPGSEHELVKKMIKNLKQSVKIYYEPLKEGVMDRHLKLEDFEPKEFYLSNDPQITDIQPGEAAAANASPRSPDIFPGNHLIGNHTVLLYKYKNQAEQMLNQVKNNVSAITGFVVGFFSNLLENSKQLPQDTLLSNSQDVQNVFSKKFDLFIKEWLPKSFFYSIDQMYKEFAKPECRAGDFVRLEQLKLLKDELALESQSTKPELDKLVKILKVLKKLVTDYDETSTANNAEASGVVEEMKDGDSPVSPKSSAIKTLSQQLEAYIKTLKLLSEYQIFFEGLCEKPHENLFAPAAQECTDLITSLFNSNVLTLKNHEINPKLKDYSSNKQREWHQKAIKWLDQYPDQNNEIKASKANHHYKIGQSYGLESTKDEAIESFNVALSLCPDMECAKNALGRIYFMIVVKHNNKVLAFQIADYQGAWDENEISKALKNYNQALEFFISTQNTHNVINVFDKILALETSDDKKGEILISKGDYLLSKYPLKAFEAYDYARGLSVENDSARQASIVKMKVALDLSAKPIISMPYFASLLGGQSNSSESASAASSPAVSQNNYDEVPVAGKDAISGAVNTDFQ